MSYRTYVNDTQIFGLINRYQRLDSFLYFFFYFKSSSLPINGKVAVFFFLNLICQVNTLIFTKKNRNIKTIPIAMHI